jgi:NAD(P)-dependent dehydrogenase (short-subunit alcohol dehydrogenase family)
MLSKENRKRILLVGGDSSLARNLIAYAKSENYEIHKTNRGLEGCKQNPDFENTHYLDLESLVSIDNFLHTIANVDFIQIYFLIGKLSRIEPLDLNYSITRSYLETYSTNTCYLIDKLLLQLSQTEKSRFVFISSRAASKKSYDALYSASKASVSAFIRSRSNFLPSNQVAVSIETGLILGSKMNYQMKSEESKHLKLSNGKLLTVDEFVTLLWTLDFDDLSSRNGSVFHLGPQY